jgi:hypothetical protein
VSEQGQCAGTDDDEAEPDENGRPEAEPHVEQPAGQAGRQRPADREYGQRRARDQRRHPERVLQVGRHVGGQADEDDADAEGQEGRRREQPPGEHPQRQHGLGGAPLGQPERHQQRRPGDEDGDGGR